MGKTRAICPAGQIPSLLSNQGLHGLLLPGYLLAYRARILPSPLAGQTKTQAESTLHFSFFHILLRCPLLGFSSPKLDCIHGKYRKEIRVGKHQACRIQALGQHDETNEQDLQVYSEEDVA